MTGEDVAKYSLWIAAAALLIAVITAYTNKDVRVWTCSQIGWFCEAPEVTLAPVLVDYWALSGSELSGFSTDKNCASDFRTELPGGQIAPDSDHGWQPDARVPRPDPSSCLACDTPEAFNLIRVIAWRMIIKAHKEERDPLSIDLFYRLPAGTQPADHEQRTVTVNMQGRTQCETVVWMERPAEPGDYELEATVKSGASMNKTLAKIQLGR